MRKVFVLVLAVLALSAPGALAQAEYVLLSGGPSLHKWEKYKAQPHDLWWMNFIRAARLRIQEIKASEPDALVTWMVYREGYRTRSHQEGQNLISHINSVRDAYGVNLIYFDQTAEVINYLNSGRPRDRVKIGHFEFFGHSNKACFMFDYSNEIDSASKVWLHENELARIRRGIFTKNAFVKSWGCHTGESFSRKWKKATGVPMWGAVGKTQYRTEQLPFLSTAGGRWAR